MDVILPQKVLDIQICAQCKQYLSYGPTKVYVKNTMKCGRCSQEPDDGTLSIYNRIASTLIFPCVNRYEGCNQLLKHQDVVEHEKTCLGGLYQCPLCPEDNYSPNSLLYLLDHYKTFHATSLLSKPNIVIDINFFNENYYLYVDNYQDLLFVIYVQLDGSKLCVNASTVGSRIESVKHCVRIAVNGIDKLKTELQPCPTLGFNVVMFHIEYRQFLKIQDSIIICSLDFDISEIFNCHVLSNKSESAINWKTVIRHRQTLVAPKKYVKEEEQKFAPNLVCLMGIFIVYFANSIVSLVDRFYTTRYCVGNTEYEKDKQQLETKLREQILKECKFREEKLILNLLVFFVGLTVLIVLLFSKRS